MSDEPRANSPAAGESLAQSPRRSRTRLVGLATAVLVTVCGAVASAIITPDRFDQWLGGGRTSTGASQTASGSPVPVLMKTVTSADSALSVRIPDGWISLPGTYDVRYDNVVDAGSALNAGTRIDAASKYSESWLYLGASKSAAARLKLVGTDTETLKAWAKASVGDLDWTQDECVLSAGPNHAREGWVLESRLWRDCGTLSGGRLWEVFGALDDGSVLVQMQVFLLPDTPDEVFDRILDSVAVAAKKLPGAKSGDSVLP